MTEKKPAHIRLYQEQFIRKIIERGLVSHKKLPKIRTSVFQNNIWSLFLIYSLAIFYLLSTFCLSTLSFTDAKSMQGIGKKQSQRCQGWNNRNKNLFRFQIFFFTREGEKRRYTQKNRSRTFLEKKKLISWRFFEIPIVSTTKINWFHFVCIHFWSTKRDRSFLDAWR